MDEERALVESSGNTVAPPPQERRMTLPEITEQVKIVQEVMRAHMKDGEHFGIIPGTDKKALLKPGAEKLKLLFRLAPKFTVIHRDLGDWHREIEVKCSLYKIGVGEFWGEGVGSCSTLEAKYRYRNVADFEVTGDPIPQDSKEKKKEYRKQGFGMKKVNGVWEWVKYKDSARVENPDIADTYNTVLKMAKKRAEVDAILGATAASDIFTQDVGEDEEEEPITPAKAAPPPPRPAPARPAASPPPPPPAQKQAAPPAVSPPVQNVREGVIGNPHIDGILSIETIPHEVTEMMSSKNRPYWRFKDYEGARYFTFDDKVGAALKEAQGKTRLLIGYTVDKYGSKVHAVAVAQPLNTGAAPAMPSDEQPPVSDDDYRG